MDRSYIVNIYYNMKYDYKFNIIYFTNLFLFIFTNNFSRLT